MTLDPFRWLRVAVLFVLLLACLTILQRAHGQTAVTPYITSQPQFFDNNGKVLASGCLFTYQAGTTTPQNTYTDSTGATPNANPIILNSAGYAPSAIWLNLSAYKFVLKSFGGTACASGSTIRTEDNLSQKYLRYDGSNVLTALADPAAALGEFWLSSTLPGRLKWSDASALHTIVGADTTDTETNKSISGSTNTLTNIPTSALVANAVTQDSFATLGVDFSTSSATYVNVTSATITMTTTGGDVLLFFSGPAHAATAAGNLTLSIDGVDGAILASLTAGGQANLPTSFLYVKTGLAAGSHTFIVRARCNGGTLTMNLAGNSNGSFAAVELKR